MLLEDKWRDDPVPEIREQYAKAVAEFRDNGLIVHELPIEEACLEITPNPRRGKNMFVLGMLCHIYSRDLDMAKDEIATTFRRKGDKVIGMNHQLFDAGYALRRANTSTCASRSRPSRAEETDGKRFIVTNGNTAVGLGVMASGMELVSMYPITPATSASHYLADVFHEVGRLRAPGRGRDRRHRLRHRRLLRRQDRLHHHLRARAGAQDRDAGPGGDGRDARW